ncbi:hypothetical protein ES703_116337 [subsurface metagenome]
MGYNYQPEWERGRTAAVALEQSSPVYQTNGTPWVVSLLGSAFIALAILMAASMRR